MSNRKNLTDEDFARASAILKNRSRGLSQVRTEILASFQNSEELHEFFIMDSSEISFKAYVFYNCEWQIKEAVKSGLALKVEKSVFDELEKVGRGSRSEIHVDFEFDSHENVEQNYDGDYYSRLR